MSFDIEETLERELREVADGLAIPPMPVLPAQEGRRFRRPSGFGGSHPWQLPLVAAALVLFVVGGAVVVANTHGTHGPAPAAPTVIGASLPTSAPEVPYVLNSQLYAAGARVPGTWTFVQGVDAGWIALRGDRTWWTGGSGVDPQQIPHIVADTVPAISPDGAYIAYVDREDGKTGLAGFQTKSGGEGMGGTPIGLGDVQNGTAVTIRAVTDQGMVIAQGGRTDLLWLPETTQADQTVDLSTTAPDQQVLGDTPGGLIVTDGEAGFSGAAYLADVSASGTLTRTASLPAHDDLIVSPGSAWLAYTPTGSTSGDVTSVPTLQAQTVDGTAKEVLTAPTGWAFRTREWTWEDEDHLVAVVTKTGTDTGTDSEADRMARCSAELDHCVLITAP